MIDNLRCLLLPTRGHTLIVPFSAVAEVVAFTEPKTIPHASKWLLGNFTWRGLEIPVVSLEMFDPMAASVIGTNLQIAVFNRLSDKLKFDFLGVLLQGIPRMSRVKRLDCQLKEDSEEDESAESKKESNENEKVGSIEKLKENEKEESDKNERKNSNNNDNEKSKNKSSALHLILKEIRVCDQVASIPNIEWLEEQVSEELEKIADD